MKCIKMLSTAGILVIAAMALLGATTASATTLCKTLEEKCALANQYGVGTVVVAHSTSAVLTGSLKVECLSKIKMTTNAASGKPLAVTVNELTWSSCKGGCTAATTTTLPTGTIEGIKGTNGHLGTIVAKGAVVKLTNCLGIGATCTATAAEAKLHFNGGEVGVANATANNVPVTISGFGCGTTGTWNAGGGNGGTPYIVTSVNGSTAVPIFASFEP